jgi:hypothetical protein
MAQSRGYKKELKRNRIIRMVILIIAIAVTVGSITGFTGDFEWNMRTLEDAIQKTGI